MKNILKVSYVTITETNSRSVLLFRRRDSVGKETPKWEFPNLVRDDVTVSDTWVVSSMSQYFPDISLVDGLIGGDIAVKWLPYQDSERNPILPNNVEIYPVSLKVEGSEYLDCLFLSDNPLYDMAFLMPIDAYQYLRQQVFGDKPFALPVTDSLLAMWYRDSKAAKISDWRKRAQFERDALTLSGIFYIADYQISYDMYMEQQKELLLAKS